jgi:hypothetical protein
MRTLRLPSLALFCAATLCYALPGAARVRAQAVPAPAPAPGAAPAVQTAPGAAPAVSDAPPLQPQPVQPAPVYPPPPAAAGYPPAATGYPAPPAGYYPQPLDPARQGAVLSELANIDARVAAVRAERSRHGLGGPITMMASGYATALIFSIVGVVHWGIAEDIQKGRYVDADYSFDEYDLNGDHKIDHEDEERARRGARTFAAIGFMGLGVGIGGSVFLARRLAARRRYDPELQSLRGRRLELLRQLQYGGALGQGSMQLTLKGRF